MLSVFLRLPILLAMAALVALTTACAGAPPPPEPESAEEMMEFQQDILADIDKVDIFLQKTQRGVNLTDFNLGWFTMILLNELGSHDQGLYDYLHTGEMNVEYYLRNSFQANPQKEIAVIGEMAKKENTAIRLAARHALEMLTQIPGPADSPDLQASSRKELAATLLRLKMVLAQVAEEAGHTEKAAAPQP